MKRFTAPSIMFLALSACGPRIPTASVSDTVVPRASTEKKCVNIYYDRMPGQNFNFGRTHGLYLQNLLGHFQNVQQYVSPIERYIPGEIERCAATLYLGNHYAASIPDSFFQDYASTKKNVAWLGYGIWRLPPHVLDTLWGVAYERLSALDTSARDASGYPGFFRHYEYKGETFTKYAGWDRKDPSRLNAAFEIAELRLLRPEAAGNVLSWARHSTNGRSSPYVLRNGNHWYVADSPFAFATEDDRYLIMADLLFDILDERPRYEGKRPAFFRVEDIHAELPLWPLFEVVDTLSKHGVPFHMSLIPLFVDPKGVFRPAGTFTRLIQNSIFIDFLNYAKGKGAEYILHGLTHQADDYLNPLGLSGDDFEFWDIVHNRAMANDSPQYVVERLQMALEILEEAGVSPVAWLTPHYQASPLDYAIFGQTFRWNVGRVIYFPDTIFEGLPSRRLSERLAYDVSGSEGEAERARHFASAKASWPQDLLPAGQFFPYEIYGDVYGQRLIPENLGNLQPFLSSDVLRARSLEEIIATMKRNRVIRDAWASLFFHPFLLQTLANGGVGLEPGDVSSVERLVRAADEYNYEFISFSKWREGVPQELRPEVIERL